MDDYDLVKFEKKEEDKKKLLDMLSRIYFDWEDSGYRRSDIDDFGINAQEFVEANNHGRIQLLDEGRERFRVKEMASKQILQVVREIM